MRPRVAPGRLILLRTGARQVPGWFSGHPPAEARAVSNLFRPQALLTNRKRRYSGVLSEDRSIHGEAAYSRWRYRSVAGMRATGRSAQPHDHPRRGRPAPGDGQSPHWTAVAAVLLAALIWSTSFAVTKVTLRALPPLTIGALRFALAAIVLGVIVHARRGAVLTVVRSSV